MKNIIITATAESVEQAQALIDAGVDRIYVGEKDYGLRLPQTLSYDEINRIAQLVHRILFNLVKTEFLYRLEIKRN